MSSCTSCEPVAIGVGLDTARYGHHATFLREDRQPAAKSLEFLECRDGYQQLEKSLSKLAQQHDEVHFHIRVDAANQYATNLLSFLHRLPWPKTISVGQPKLHEEQQPAEADAASAVSSGQEPRPQLAQMRANCVHLRAFDSMIFDRDVNLLHFGDS